MTVVIVIVAAGGLAAPAVKGGWDFYCTLKNGVALKTPDHCGRNFVEVGDKYLQMAMNIHLSVDLHLN